MNRIRLLICLCCLIGLTACARHGTPKIPTGISRQGIGEYDVGEFKKELEAYKACTGGISTDKETCRGTTPNENLETARIIRDRMINRIEMDVERNYREYEAKLFYRRASSDVAADIAELGVSAAIGVTAQVAVKDMLAAALTSFKGTRLSVDRNFFREKTTEIIVSKMQAYRDRVRNRITEKMAKLSVRDYPFEAAWRDLVEHFYAGTLQGGIQALANDAGKDAAAAKEETKEIENELLDVPTPEELEQAGDIRTRFASLSREIRSTDAAKAKAAREKAQQLLTKLGGLAALSAADQNNGEKLLTALRRFISQSDSHPEWITILKEGLP